MEAPIISGVAHDLGEAKITIAGVQRTGARALVFEILATAGHQHRHDRSKRVPPPGLRTSRSFCRLSMVTRRWRSCGVTKSRIGYETVTYDDQVAKVSLVGAAMRSHPGVSATTFPRTGAGINVEMISATSVGFRLLCALKRSPGQCKAIHTAFGLDAGGEAVVYAGTGR